MAQTRNTERTIFAGVGAYVPERVLTNQDLEGMVDTSAAWIEERTGIQERRIAADGESASDMALAAATEALRTAGLAASDLDMIIVGTVTGDTPFPACAAFLQEKLGCKNIPSFDVSAACAGFLYATAIADRFIQSGSQTNVLVVGVELLSRITDWADRTTCILFGDGAGAAVLTRGPAGGKSGLRAVRLHTDGTLTASLCMPAGGSSLPVDEAVIQARKHKIHMVGRDIFKAAVRNMTSVSMEVLTDADARVQDVRWVVPHQANLRIITQVAARLEVPLDRFILNVERYGNTSSASIPIALSEGLGDGRIKTGDTVLMCALGAGVSWAGALVDM